jgi:hypothetical protein
MSYSYYREVIIARGEKKRIFIDLLRDSVGLTFPKIVCPPFFDDLKAILCPIYLRRSNEFWADGMVK